uniref:Anaphase-promoting complex subunit 4 WD40 domain-containing protein n=1 Tax=Leptocylindrus danicus TaxID=163516 RepID=A0A7S2L5F1_9STRA
MTDAFRQDSQKLLRAPNILVAADTFPSSLAPLLPLDKEAVTDIRETKGVNLHHGLSRSLISLGGSWNQVGQDFVGNADGAKPFQCGISDDGNRIVVATPRESTYHIYGGVVRVYDRAEDGWVQVGPDSVGFFGTRRGWTTKISGDGSTIAVGERLWGRHSGGFRGRVLVFKLNEDDVWTLIGKFEGEADTDDRTGRHISLSGNGEAIVIGVHRNNKSTGRVYVYTYDGTSWTLVGTVDGDSASGRFGYSVDISTDGNTVAAGCRRCNSVRIYDTSDGLVKIGDIPSDGADDEFGCGVSLSANGNVIAIASCGTNISQVKVFQKNDQGNWPRYGNTIDGFSVGDVIYLQLSLSSDGQTLAILTHILMITCVYSVWLGTIGNKQDQT